MWGPFSELYGRQLVFAGTYTAFTAFNAAAAGAPNIYGLLILRFFAAAFGSSPLTNAGGVIADLFNANERGVAMSIFSAAPFMGPVLGPIIGGYVSERLGPGGWRWIFYAVSIADAVIQIFGLFALKETYPPLLLKRKVRKLRKETGNNDLFSEYDDRTHTHLLFPSSSIHPLPPDRAEQPHQPCIGLR